MSPPRVARRGSCRGSSAPYRCAVGLWDSAPSARGCRGHRPRVRSPWVTDGSRGPGPERLPLQPRLHNVGMFLAGTLLNVATVLIGTTLGLLVGARMPPRLQSSLTTGLGFFVIAIAISMAIRIFGEGIPVGDGLAVLVGLLCGVVIGELMRLQDGLEWLGAW